MIKMHACYEEGTGLDEQRQKLCLDWRKTKVIRSFGVEKKENVPTPTLHPLFLHTFLQSLPFQRFINSVKPVLGSLVVMGRSV